MPVLSRGLRDGLQAEDPTPLVAPRGSAGELAGREAGTSSSEEDALNFSQSGGNSGGVRRLAAVCAVVAILGVAALLAAGPGQLAAGPGAAPSAGQPLAAAPASAVTEGLTELAAADGEGEEDEGEEDEGARKVSIWDALKKLHPRAKKDTSAEDALEEEAAQPLPDDTPKVCTDGWVLAFKTKLFVGTAPGNQSILTSSTGAMELSIQASPGENASLTFQIETFNFGPVKISRDVEPGKTYAVTARKDENAVCLDLCVQTGASFTCLPGTFMEPDCTFAPAAFPETSFQMKPPGALALENGTVASAQGFGQTSGSVPVSFTLSNVPFEKLYESMDDWDALVLRMKKTLAGLAGNSVVPVQVAVTPASGAPNGAGDEGTLLQATVMQQDAQKGFGFACRVQDEMASWARGQDIKATAFNLAVKSTCSDFSVGDASGASSGDIEASSASVPGLPMACSSYRCRLSKHHVHLTADAQCLGGGCESTCCQAPWSDKPLPYGEGNDTVTMTSTTTKSMEALRNNDGAKVTFDCYKEACCKLSGPPGTVPMPRPFPIGLGLIKGKDWDYTPNSPASVEDCQEWCAMDEKCTGVTYLEGGKCAIFYNGECTLAGEGGSKWRYPDRECSGAETCNAIRSAAGQPDSEDAASDQDARPAEEWKMPNFFSPPATTTTTTTPSTWQAILINQTLTLAEKQAAWAKAQGEKIRENIAKDLNPPINTDGYSFEFNVEVNLKMGACAKAQDIITSPLNAITVRTAPQAGDKPMRCRAEFQAQLLNNENETGGCQVQTSRALSEGGKYKLTIKRDTEQCCIAWIPSKGIGAAMAKWFEKKIYEPTCVNRSSSLEPGEFQIRPVTSLYNARTNAVHTKNFEQTAASLAMSFYLDNVNYEALVADSSLTLRLKDAIQESVSYSGSVGLHYDQVVVSFKRAWCTNHTDRDEEMQANEEHEEIAYSMPESGVEFTDGYGGAKHWGAIDEFLGGDSGDSELESEEASHAERAQEQFGELMTGTTQAPSTTEPPATTTPRPTTTREITDQMQGIPRWDNLNRRLGLFGNWGSKAEETIEVQAEETIEVQISIKDLGSDADAIKAELEKPATATVILARINRALGVGATVRRLGIFGKKTSTTESDEPVVVTGKILIHTVQLPAAVTKCANFACPSYRKNMHPNRVCYGAWCRATCCQPRFCSQVACQAPLVNNFLASGKRCSSEDECGQTCCQLPCFSYRCMGNSCPRPNNWLLTATPDNAQKVCCREHKPCCNAPIAACISCLKCQTPEAYCMSCLFGFGRRLSSSNATEPLSLPAPGALPPLSQNDLSGGLPPMTLQQPALTPSELAQDELEAADAIATGGASLDRSLDTAPALRGDGAGGGGGGAGGARKASQAKNNYRRLQSAEQLSLQAGMMDQHREAQAFRLKMEASAVAGRRLADTKPTADINGGDYTTGATTADEWKKLWKQVIFSTKAHAHGLTAGCEGQIAAPCPYYFKSIFCLHRGCGLEPKSVRAVAVLTDTFHAVTCGDDGLCWVWKICSGSPRQVFFPNVDDRCPTTLYLQPQFTVSVLHDATFIVSGGFDQLGEGGSAYIWDWRYGFQKANAQCGGGPFLSSITMPAFRMVSLGCSTGYTTLWDWDTNSQIEVPFCKKTFEEILGEMNAYLIRYKNYHLDGIQRLFAEKVMITQQVFMKALAELDPNFMKSYNATRDIYNIFHKNRFGPTNALVYVPVRIRFAAGMGDGKVLYFDGETGQILMAMMGHQGPVNALAASPTQLQVLSGGEDGTVRLWDLRTGAQLALFYQAYGGPIYSLAVIPGGNKVVVGSWDGYVRIWSINTGVLLCAINTGGGPVYGVAVNPSNPLGQIITANADGYARVFNPRSAETAHGANR